MLGWCASDFTEKQTSKGNQNSAVAAIYRISLKSRVGDRRRWRHWIVFETWKFAPSMNQIFGVNWLWNLTFTNKKRMKKKWHIQMYVLKRMQGSWASLPTNAGRYLFKRKEITLANHVLNTWLCGWWRVRFLMTKQRVPCISANYIEVSLRYIAGKLLNKGIRVLTFNWLRGVLKKHYQAISKKVHYSLTLIFEPSSWLTMMSQMRSYRDLRN